MANVSQTAINAAIRDIQNGVTYPDFWVNRYGEDEQVQTAEMQDGEIVPVYGYHYTGTVNVWTENGIEQR